MILGYINGKVDVKIIILGDINAKVEIKIVILRYKCEGGENNTFAEKSVPDKFLHHRHS